MLRIIQNSSADGAKRYYSSADYYSQGQELIGNWGGKGAVRLGLVGEISKEAWDRLCDNQHPTTGDTLTQRRRQDRRVGYDFSFHVPKSVSILYGWTQSEAILGAFRDSVRETMRDMEAEMKTRVRQGGRNEDRTTGEMVWGEYVHFTSRPVDGVPDPQLHAHCFVFNTTWDREEGRWKAGQIAGLKRDAPFFEAVFHARLARRMAELGLDVERTPDRWEVDGVPRSAVEKLSRRTALIEKLAHDKGITDPHEKDQLGATTRERKVKQLAFADLQARWKAAVSADELAQIDQVIGRVGGPGVPETPSAARTAVDQAIEHCFERQSVVPERKVLTEALKRSVGAASVEAVTKELAGRDLVWGERDGRRVVTTREVLAEEQRMIAFARDGRGTCRRLGRRDHRFTNPKLNEGQRRAVAHVLNSPDRVILVRGAAGVGKTWSMREAVDAIQAHGTRVFTFAPSAGASRGVLREAGFADAETVARLLVDEQIQQQVKGQVIWIDEAGLLGSKTMGEVFDLAAKLDARVVLSGDRRQHGSIERGAALRLLETEAGLAPAEIKEIQRQSGEYKQAIEAMSEGRVEDGFKILDELQWIREVPDADRYKVLAADYVASVRDGKTALVVSPTHREGDQITGEIRAALKESGTIDRDERVFTTLAGMDLTEAQRKESVNYAPGDVLEFHQNAKGYQKGQRVVVADPLAAPLDQAARFQPYRRDTLSLAPGDVIRITKNGKTVEGTRVNNGDLLTVQGFASNGDIIVGKDRHIAKEWGHITYGYVVTSHASQGKSVNRVLVGQSSESFPASSQEQFYVSASRGRLQVVVYTDDKEALLDAVSRADERLTATEFVSGRERRERGRVLQEHREVVQSSAVEQPLREREEPAFER